MLTYDKILRRQKIRGIVLKILLMLFLAVMSILVGWFIGRLGR